MGGGFASRVAEAPNRARRFVWARGIDSRKARGIAPLAFAGLDRAGKKAAPPLAANRRRIGGRCPTPRGAKGTARFKWERKEQSEPNESEGKSEKGKVKKEK